MSDSISETVEDSKSCGQANTPTAMTLGDLQANLFLYVTLSKINVF